MKHIQTIEVKGLWNRLNLTWELSDSVNILSGGNGSGKSTVLGCLADLFMHGRLSSTHAEVVDSIKIVFDDGEVISSLEPFDPIRYRVDVISTFDMAVNHKASLNGNVGQKIDTELDWELFRLEKKYLSYQLEIGRQVIAALTEGKSHDSIAEITSHKNLFYDTIDTLFAHTGKKIDRTQDNLSFLLADRCTIALWQLSSGEKQILIILTTVLVQNRRRSIMIMDEPEISLHFDWQKRLLEDILRLNPALQIVAATHSPALVMGGWIDHVTQIDELFG